MARKRELSVETRSAILTLWQEKYSMGQVAKKYKISTSTVWNIIKKKEETGSVVNRKRSGRPRITSVTEGRRVATTSKRNRLLTAPEITNILNNSREVPVSTTTVKRRLMEAGLGGRVAARKSLLRPQNKKKRLDWAKQHEKWTVDEWKRVLWTDESKFEIFGSKRRVFVRRKVGERMMKQRVVPTVKHGGGSVMVWDCFGGNNVGDIVKIEGKMTKSVFGHFEKSRHSLWKSDYWRTIHFSRR